jgi:hypothetical protein
VEFAAAVDRTGLEPGSLVLIAGFIVGEGVHLSGWHEYLGFVFFPFGISVGMVVAWWSEALGGSITVGSLAVFYLIYLRTAGTFPPGWAWVVFAAPGFLFLLAAFLLRRTNPAAA